ncbi:MAG: 7TM diverse intracellular signaling domain-containing protein [Pseudomonadota bacterium]
MAMLFICALFLQNTVAQTPALNIGSHGSYGLSNHFAYFEDTGATRTLDDILQADIQTQFKPVEQGPASANFGATDSAIWLKIQLHTEPGAPRHWMLEVANAPMDSLDTYLSRADGSYDHQVGGDTQAFVQRAVAHRNHVKPLDLTPGASTNLYLRVASQGVVAVPTTLWQPAALRQSDQQTYSVFSLYLGLLIGLLLYNLLLFVSVRDPAYLLYAGMVACIGLGVASSDGIAAQFLWPESVWWNNRSPLVFQTGSGAFSILFVRSYLGSKSNAPRLDRWMRALVGLWVVAFLASLFGQYKLGRDLLALFSLVGIVVVIAAMVVSIRRRHPGAKFFALAWTAFLIGVLVQVVHNTGLMPSGPLAANAVEIGSVFEMLLLSLALADRINVAKREKELALVQVTTEQATVQALQQLQQRYRSVIEHVAEGMVVMQNERIVFVNTRATEILEAGKDQIIAQGVLRHVHTDDRAMLMERVQQRLAGGEVPERCQVRFELPGRPSKWLEFGDSMVPWDDGQGLLVFFLDVTQRHAAELETRAAVQRQQELNDLRSRFVAMTSHEFRTPLAAILSSQDLLKTYGDRIAESEKLELLGLIESGVKRMTSMLERVLLLGQVDAQMLEFKPQKIDLKALCHDLVLEAQHQHPGNPCRAVVDFQDTAGGDLYDEKLLRHIFGNLLSNAIKYSPQGGEVRLQVYAQGEHTVFDISDQGIGIPAGELGALFESFQRASNVGTIQGTGLGLAIVKESVELHGGTITVDSRAGHGSCFTVRLRQPA